MPASTNPPIATTPPPSDRLVIEHALVEYGYTPETARFLIDRLIAESRSE